MRSAVTLSVLLTVCAGAFAAPAAAQRDAAIFVVPRPLVAIARNDLRFGEVFPGIPTSINPGDPKHAGLFEIRGADFGAVRIELMLPTALTSMNSQEIPLSFGPGDGAAASDQGGYQSIPFDPRQPLITTLGTDGKLFIQLGGTALPIRSQMDGTYRATITLSIFDLGS